MEDSVFQMQQAAKQRVHRAREQARRIVEENNRRCAVPTAYSRPLRYSEEREAVCPSAERCDDQKGGIGEQGLLLLLAVLLYHNRSSPEIILALLYLAL